MDTLSISQCKRFYLVSIQILEDPDYTSISGPDEEELAGWRRLGPLGKLHNIVKHIMYTPQRIQGFKQLSGGLMPHRDNGNRWNSWFLMLDWSLTRVKAPLQQYILSETGVSNDMLSAADWQTLTQIRDFLKNFHDVTKHTEGRKATINRVLPTLDFLLDKFEEGAGRFNNDDFLAVSMDAGWRKLQEYWNRNTGRTPVYIAAIVLDPSQ